MPLVFLGGTCDANEWRRGFIERLVARGVGPEILFDPVVEDWNEEARRREERAKRDADLLVFYLGNPQRSGEALSAFSLVEATVAVCDDPKRSLLIFDLEGVDRHARWVLEETEKLLRERDSGVVLCSAPRRSRRPDRRP